MIWSTPSSRYAHVVARSALGGGIGGWATADVLAMTVAEVEWREDERAVMVVVGRNAEAGVHRAVTACL